MAKLILSMEGLVLKEIPLIRERTTIGRKPHNDIQIDNLAISGEHAVIVMVINDAFLEDLDSTNGTLVNGQPVKKHFLQDGDVVELGKYRLKYLSETDAAQVPDDFEKTMVLRPDTMRGAIERSVTQGLGGVPASAASAAVAGAAAAAVAGAVSPPAAAAAGVSPTLTLGGIPGQTPVMEEALAPKARLCVLTGASAGRELELVKPTTTLGKQGVQVAMISRRPHGYFIVHVEGANLPSVNGERLVTGKPHALHDRDIIELGGIRMEFRSRS